MSMMTQMHGNMKIKLPRVYQHNTNAQKHEAEVATRLST